MYVGDYYRNVPVVGGIVGSIVIVGSKLGVPGALDQCCCGAAVQTFAAAC